MASEQFSKAEVPHFAGYLTGIRAMELYPDGRLYSPQRHFLWRKGENLARCSFGGGQLFDPYYHTYQKVSQVAAKECYCGFYAYFDAQHADSYMPFVDGLYTVIKAYGRITYGTQGFRCEKAQIIGFAPRFPAMTMPPEPRAPKTYQVKLWPILTVSLSLTLASVMGMFFSPWFALGLFTPVLAGVFWSWLQDRKLKRYREALKQYSREHNAWLQGTLRWRPPPGYPDLNPEWVKRMIEKYPGATWYDSLDEMIEAHPLSSANDITVGD